ncbi:hypothetical protein GCM10018793_17940 [Streptomyces sulfonofaciens]|uniref:Uncharacterized protein n=1 Tax=Streptomyces sulfonofaciens TaxID=68272 RepID=A0A919G0H4_9ACTN|nr:hypothetical protein [Streptomyces sulfonofaciens]GHH75196.1 hypothetical protein GCM10018793_17940 [Streptomyces sulfonofaciens]
MTQLLQCGNRTRLTIPAPLSASLGYDAVGIPAEHGRRIVRCLPAVGCVFAWSGHWWWIVPAGSDIDVSWPRFTRYAVDGCLDAPNPGPAPEAPRLVHRPRGGSPYTPPIPLYFLTCHIAGVVPSWSLETGG